MPIVKLPNGEYVNVADGTTPERLQQIMAQAKPKAPARKTYGGENSVATLLRPQQPQNGEQAEVQRRVQKRAGDFRNSGWFGGLRDFTSGYTSSFADELAGGVGALTRGIPNAIARGDTSEIGKEYRITRDVVREEDRRRRAQGGVGGVASEIAGAVASPLGKVAKGLSYGAEAVGLTRALTASRAGGAVARGASRVLSTPVGAAVGAGAAQGALNGMGQDESGTLSGMLGSGASGATIGGITGGVFGTAMNGAQRVAQVVRDRAPEAASRTAYTRIAELLGKAERPASSEAGVARLPMTPQSVQRELSVANGRGTDMRVMDVMPGMQAQAAKLARNPSLSGSNRLIETAETRMGGRAQEMEDQIAGRITPRTGTDALKFQQSNTAARKAAGARDYDAVLDRPITWTQRLDDFVTKPNPLVQSAVKEAERLMRSQDIDPRTLGLVFGPDGVLQRVERPTMRTFDYLKRGLDRVTRSAKDAGDNDAARIAGDQVNALRTELARVNPEYKKVLDTQRSYFQQDSAAELGKGVVQRLQGAKADPRQLLQEIQQIHPNDRDALRTGFADALMSLRDQRTAGKGPVAVLQSLMRTPNQRRVLENLFEGKGNLGRFEKWLAREMRATKTDAMVAGPQSITSLMQGTEVLGGGGAGKLAGDTLRGYAYGGIPGAVSAGARSVSDLAKGVGPAANEEIARILMGRGDDLVQGVGDATAFQIARRAANRRRVTRAARGGQQPYTDTLGDN